MQHRAFRSNLFAAAVLFPRCFFLSTDMDVGGSKQKRVLLSKTCYQTCTRMYRFDNRSQKPHLHYTCGKKDFCFNRCPEYFPPYSCLLLTYGRNSFYGEEGIDFMYLQSDIQQSMQIYQNHLPYISMQLHMPRIPYFYTIY